MKSMHLATLLAVAMTGCAMHQPSRVQTFSGTGQYEPLQARLYPPYYGQISFTVDRPAHVAVFEIVPGRGVSMVYPQGARGSLVSQHMTWQNLSFLPQRWSYLDAAYGSQSGPLRYFYMIASEEPLRLEQFQYGASSVRSELGLFRYSAMRPYDTMEDLAYSALPNIDSDRWVTDVYVDWGYDWGYGWGPSSFAASSYRSRFCSARSYGFQSYYANDPCSTRYSRGSLVTGGIPAYPIQDREPRNPLPADSGRTRITPGEVAAEGGRERIAGELEASADRTRWDDGVRDVIKQSVVERQAVERSRINSEMSRTGARDARRSNDRSRTGATRPDARPAPSNAGSTERGSTSSGESSTGSSSGERTREPPPSSGGRSRTP